MGVLVYIGQYILLIILLCLLVYLFSRIQMKAWTHGLDQHLMSMYNNSKKRKDEQEKNN